MDAVLELALDGLRLLGRLLLHIVVEFIGDAIGRVFARVWRPIHGWVAWVTGWRTLAIPISILLIMALVAGVFVAIVKIGQAILA